VLPFFFAEAGRAGSAKMSGTQQRPIFSLGAAFSMALRAVIFDYGMVLSGPADSTAHHDLVQIFGAPAEDFEREYWALRHAYDEGQFDGAGYWQRCAERAGVALTSEQVRELIANDIRMWSTLNQTMVDWAIAISRSGFKTGILSNIPFEIADVFKEIEWIKGFTHNTWSCYLRLAKPDPAIYHHVVDALRVSPEEILFLDDRQENVLSAEAVGLQGILFRDVAQLHGELGARGLTDLLPALPTGQVVFTPAL
jgi:putative hydrolase of the HAD superfamily